MRHEWLKNKERERKGIRTNSRGRGEGGGTGVRDERDVAAAAGWGGRRARGAGARGPLAFARVGILERLGEWVASPFPTPPFVPSPNPKPHPLLVAASRPGSGRTAVF